MKIVQLNIKPATYKEISIDSLKINEVLVFDIYIKRLNNYVIIIEAGKLLSDELYKKLKKQDNLYI
ncbi:MAG: hypothetical protein U9P72_04505 [Campylobacterota bacterium]|nr:hypothetical protein [Campylobacterota bacterium]